MRLLFTALACLLSVSLSAQEQVITYPYNPDADSDSLIAVPDALEFLTLYGNEFIPEPVMVDGVVITEWLESNSNSLGGGGCDYAFPDGYVGEPIAISLFSSEYTVPENKNLYIFNAYASGNAIVQLDGIDFLRFGNDKWHYYADLVLAGSGTVLSHTDVGSGITQVNLFGYLVDEDYFADCGGGGESSEGGSSSSSTQIYPKIGSTQSPYNPVTGELYVINLNYPPNHFVIPSGKIFEANYWTGTGLSDNRFTLYRGDDIFPNIPLALFDDLILIENDSIIVNFDINYVNPTFFMSGQLYDIDPLVDPFFFYLNTGDVFSVPQGKLAIVQSMDNGCAYVGLSSGTINLNNISGNLISANDMVQCFRIWPENSQLTAMPASGCDPGTDYIYGYGWFVNE